MTSLDPHSYRPGISALYWRVVIKPHAAQCLLISFLMLVAAVLEMATVGFAVPLLDAVTDPSRAGRSGILPTVRQILSSFGVPSDANAVVFALLVVVCTLFFTRTAFSLVHQYLTAAAGQRLRREVKTALFHRFLFARYDYIIGKGRGAVLYDLNQPAEQLYASITQLGIIVTATLDSVLLLGLLFYLSWWATLIIGVLAVGGVQGLRRYLDWRARECGYLIYELNRELEKIEVDAIDGLKVVKTHSLEKPMVAQQQAILWQERRPILQHIVYEQAPYVVNEFVASGIVLGLGAVTFLFPEVGMRFSMMVGFMLAVRRISPAAARINSILVDLNKSSRSVEIVQEALHSTPLEAGGTEEVAQVTQVELRDVLFTYDTRPDQPVLRDVNLTMRRGRVTAIVGPTGGGKTTIAHLILGLYRPDRGSVLVNGRDARNLNLKAWRAKIGFVSQDTFLFNTTIRENIALWDERVSQSELEKAAKMAQLDDFVRSLPEGYDTVVGDRGLRLSGGQCQRVAIARAILRNPEVLVFDEATSALDNLTESAVYQAIDALRRDAIVIVIAHRLSTIKDADQIAVLSSGKIIELGTHDSLMASRGVYAQLHEQGVEGKGDGGGDGGGHPAIAGLGGRERLGIRQVK